MNFKEQIIDGLNQLAKTWEVKFIHKGKWEGCTVSAVYLERCIVSVFFKENDCEYQCNSDAFIDLLLRGEMLSVRNYIEKEIYPRY